MKQFSKGVAALMLLVLVGAGCPAEEKASTNANSSQESTNASADTDAGTIVTTPSEEDDEKTEGTSNAETVVEIDDTWKTYANAALGFEFKWPTKGRYAPQWNVTFEKEGSTDIKDGCFVAAGAKTAQVKGDGADFCRTETTDDAGSKTRFVTKIGTTYVVLTFTKTKDARAAAGFAAEEYDAHLEQIVSTFKKTK